jgi:hypothetical protein
MDAHSFYPVSSGTTNGDDLIDMIIYSAHNLQQVQGLWEGALQERWSIYNIWSIVLTRPTPDCDMYIMFRDDELTEELTWKSPRSNLEASGFESFLGGILVLSARDTRLRIPGTYYQLITAVRPSKFECSLIIAHFNLSCPQVTTWTYPRVLQGVLFWKLVRNFWICGVYGVPIEG